MKPSPHSLYPLQLLLATFLLFLATPMVSANVAIEFLGQPTDIEDRATPSGALLSELLEDIDQDCKESSLARARDKLDKKLAEGKITEESDKFLKERAKRYFKCLKKAVHELKHEDVLSKDEEKALQKIIKTAKKEGVIHDEEPTPSSMVNGRVTLADGTTLDGVDIMASSQTDDASTSTADGLFSLDLDPSTKYVLQLSGAGLADQVVPVMSPADGSAINIEITMIERGELQTFTAGAGGLLSGADGASVDVDGVNWVDAQGIPVSGDVVATITPVDVSNSALLGAFPGEFNGIAAGESDAGAIVSLGAVEFEFSQNGVPVQPAPGFMVNILIPIYSSTNQDGSTILPGQTIPLWSLDESTGIWTQDGDGVVVESPESPTGLALAAAVSHFSWWNCDVSMSAATAFVTVLSDQPGTAVVRATTDADIGWRPNMVETVLVVNVTSGPLDIPSTGEVCFSADITFDDGSTASTIEVCVTPDPNGTEIIELFAPVVGTLSLTRSPAGDIGGFTGFPVERVRIFPTTLETAVAYSIAEGSLPNGVDLVQVTPTRAELSGIPTGAGAFSATIEGDDGAETASVIINYNISSDQPPPLFDTCCVYAQLADTSASYDLNQDLDLSNGGAADSWVLLEDIEGGPIPPWLVLDPATGILTTNENVNDFFFGKVRVTNSSGSDEAFLEVCAGDGCQLEF